mgnify:CR=1 FL=1
MTDPIQKILLIGAGGIGSRHLQGLKRSTIPIEIGIVDPSKSSLEIAKGRYNEVENNEKIKEINYYSNLEDVSSKIDLAIVATTSEVRGNVIKELLKNKVVNNLVLEKVLFQTIDEYIEIEELLQLKNVKCWVNHPRRMHPFYVDLKQKLKDTNQLSFNLQGGDWGLACNALHYIDLLAYLVNGQKLELNNEFLDGQIYSSKREGFKEVNGLLIGKVGNHVFTLYCQENNAPMVLSIISDDMIVKINEVDGKVIYYENRKGWKEEEISQKIEYYQSELTHLLIEDILLIGKCDLTTYSQAKEFHVPFIKCIKEHFEKISGVIQNSCQIT